MIQTAFQQFSELFPRTLHSILRDFDSPTGETLGLNRTQIHTLMKIQKYGTISMGSLCHHIGITKGAMTAIIDTLLDSGYVARDRAADDRRKVLVKLTDIGESIAAACRREIEDSFEARLDSLSAEEQEAFRQSIETLGTIISKMENTRHE